jgi:hypothetical protein
MMSRLHVTSERGTEPRLQLGASADITIFDLGGGDTMDAATISKVLQQIRSNSIERTRMTQTTMGSAAAVLAIVGFLLFAMAGPSWSETPTAGGGETAAAAGCPVPDDPKDPCDRDHTMGDTNTLKQLQKQLNNPLSTIWSFQLEQDFQFLNGDASSSYRNSYKTIFQPVMPLPLTENITWINRPIFSFLSTPTFDAEDGDWDRTAGLAGFTYETWFTATNAGEFKWALGGVFSMPLSGNDALSSRKYSLGPSGVLVWTPGDWNIGALANWLFSVGGTSAREHVNEASLQYFIMWSGLPNHWQIVSSPTITYNKVAGGGEAWAVPIGIGLGKMIKVGKLPVKVQLEYDYYVVHPNDFGPRHLITLKFTPVIPALIKKSLF